MLMRITEDDSDVECTSVNKNGLVLHLTTTITDAIMVHLRQTKS